MLPLVLSLQLVGGRGRSDGAGVDLGGEAINVERVRGLPGEPCTKCATWNVGRETRKAFAGDFGVTAWQKKETGASKRGCSSGPVGPCKYLGGQKRSIVKCLLNAETNRAHTRDDCKQNAAGKGARVKDKTAEMGSRKFTCRAIVTIFS